MALVLGAATLTACSDDDNYWASTTPLLSDGSVVTGSSDVTATTATFNGSVSGLENVSAASYATGFYWGYAQDALEETAMAASASTFSASLSGLTTGQTLYYQAFVTLQGRVTYKGEVKSLVTTDARVTTGDATGVDFAQATMAGSVTNATADATAGIMIAASDDEETVRAGLRLDAAEVSSFSITKTGLLPATTYYYVAFLDLGSGIVYGDVKQFTTSGQGYSDIDAEFVDLGLSVKWAKRNIGAKSETDLGGLFAFGDMTGVNPSLNPEDYSSEDTYRTANDLAYAVTGGEGTLPTADMFEELFRLCTTEWTVQDGVQGYKVTGPSGNSIFLPAAGKRVGSTVIEAGTHGYYLTGSHSHFKAPSTATSQFAVDYEFSQSSGVRSARAVYEAMSVRPVSTHKALKKEWLYNTWKIDLRPDGTTVRFDGPAYFMSAADSWANITDGEPVDGTWIWAADASQNWIWGGNTRDFGSMTLTEDGKVIVTRNAADGTTTVEEGTYTVDALNKKITLSVDLLNIPEQAARGDNAKTELNILSLTEETLQIGMLIDGNTGQVSFNYVADKFYSGYQASLLFWDGNDSNWGSIAATQLLEAGQQYTLEVQGQRAGGKVVVLDFPQLVADHPNAIVTIDKIECDGKEVAFDANKLKYGDLEGNGNYRIEIFNIWGAGTGSDSPFGGGAKEQEDALAFNSSLKITYTVHTLDGFAAGLSAVDSNWGGDWGSEKTYISLKGGFPQEYTVTNTHAAQNGMVVVLDIEGLAAAFPNAKFTLTKVECDGQSLSFDESKIKYGDIENKGNYRIEIFNIWGSGTQNDSPFGGGAKETEPAISFTTDMKVTFTLDNLF